MKVSVAQLCLTFWDSMDCSPPGSSVHGIFSRQEYWSGLPFPSPGDLPRSRGQTDSLPPEPVGKPQIFFFSVTQMVMNLPAMQETQETRF